MSEIVVVGVRHHSPACARLVMDVIMRHRPEYVLVEGPSDMNDRIEELLLPHRMPIALFSFRQTADGQSHGVWTPFCDFSPELVAMRAAKEVGAKSLFVDLPAWDKVFDAIENRFGPQRPSDRLFEIADSLGFEDTDALWDHLFEQPQPLEVIEAGLTRYFDVLRSDEPPSDRDGPREDLMAQYIAAARADCERRGKLRDGAIVVVCGGFHKPALERMWKERTPEFPKQSTVDAGTRVGSYFIPYSLERLDSFSGYASGMPSPGYYQEVWDRGPEEAADHMLFHAVQHLRKKAQRVSPADAIAASTLAHGLRTMRAHRVLTRIDVLDGLAGALVKDALDAPLPWTRRGTLARHTDAMLVELVRAFSGEKYGVLAKGTPAPPLVRDVFEELSRVGIEPARTPQKVITKLAEPAGAAKSHVLHRLRILDVPGFTRKRGPNLARGKTDLSEEWNVERAIETDPALVVAALYGGTLQSAAEAKLQERVDDQADSAILAAALFDAASAGIFALTDRFVDHITMRVATEPSFSILGEAMLKLLSLWRGDLSFDQRRGPSGENALSEVLLACFERALWLFEGIQGATATMDEGDVKAVRAIRDLVRHGPPSIASERARAIAVCERRVADEGAPPALRGAALGAAWSLREIDDVASRSEPTDESQAIAALRAAWRAETVGDYLGGLFVLAREEVLRSESLLAAIDAALTGMMHEEFMIALPAMRQAFEFFPPRERLDIAEGVLSRGGKKGADPSQLLRTAFNPAAVQEGARIDAAVRDLARRFGIDDDGDRKDGGSS